MSDALPTGKLPAPLLTELLRGVATPPEVRLGPAVGEDAAAIDLPAGTLVAATDPITLTGADVGRYAVVVNANDVAVTGVRPRWFLATVLLPVGTSTDDVRALFEVLHATLRALRIALVGGHTEVTAAVTQPVVVGQMLGHATEGGVVTTGGAGPGEVVLQVGPVPVEGAAVLASAAADRVDEHTLAAARDAVDVPGIAVVEAALRAAALGATAMHDPTEGGLAAGLHELAQASGVRLVVDRGAVRWFRPGLAICAALDADPWATLASGSLLATVPAERADRALAELADAGFEVAVLARVETGQGVVDAAGGPVPWPDRDEVARLA